MDGWLYFERINSEYQRILPGISETAEAALWITTRSVDLEPNPFHNLNKAFDNLRPILRHSRHAVKPKLPIEVLDRERVFGKWPHISRGLITHTTMTFENNPQRIYSDVAWWSPPDEDSNAEDISSTGIFSYIPDDTKTAEDWAKMVLGFTWVMLTRKWSFEASIPLIDTHAVFLSYIKITLALGGIPGFMCNAVDTDAKILLLLVGDYQPLSIAATKLSEFYDKVEEEEFTTWLKRGIYLPRP